MLAKCGDKYVTRSFKEKTLACSNSFKWLQQSHMYPWKKLNQNETAHSQGVPLICLCIALKGKCWQSMTLHNSVTTALSSPESKQCRRQKDTAGVLLYKYWNTVADIQTTQSIYFHTSCVLKVYKFFLKKMIRKWFFRRITLQKAWFD